MTINSRIASSLRLGFVVALSAAGPLFAAEAVLPLGAYLDQVRSHNEAYRGWALGHQAALERERSKDLVTGPSAFASARYSRDEKLPSFPGFDYERLDNRNYTAGFEGKTSFGLSARLAYEVDYTDFVGIDNPAFTGTPLSYYDSRPVVSLTQQLWQNGFGRGTRAQIDAAQSEARSAAMSAEAQMRAIMVEAEASYWRLQVTRELVRVQQIALESAQGINDYTTRQTSRNLADEADALQSRALLESRRLELKAAGDAERAALRRFNALRNAPPSEIAPALASFNLDTLLAVSTPVAGRRADVLAGEEQARLAAANAILNAEDTRPVLEAFGSYAMNGRDAQFNPSISDSYSANRPTAVAGLRFSVPLEFGAVNATRTGALREASASRLRQQQAEQDERSALADLTATLGEARERLRLARDIESAQLKKLEYERRRLKQGRTSTYQVLLFEQDFSQAQLARISAARAVLDALSQYRLYNAALPESGS